MARIKIEDLPLCRDLSPEEAQELFGAGPKQFRPRFEALEERKLMSANALADLSAQVLQQIALNSTDSQVSIEQSVPSLTPLNFPTLALEAGSAQQFLNEAGDNILFMPADQLLQSPGQSAGPAMLGADPTSFIESLSRLPLVQSALSPAGTQTPSSAPPPGTAPSGTGAPNDAGAVPAAVVAPERNVPVPAMLVPGASATGTPTENTIMPGTMARTSDPLLSQSSLASPALAAASTASPALAAASTGMSSGNTTTTRTDAKQIPAPTAPPLLEVQTASRGGQVSVNDNAFSTVPWFQTGRGSGNPGAIDEGKADWVGQAIDKSHFLLAGKAANDPVYSKFLQKYGDFSVEVPANELQAVALLAQPPAYLRIPPDAALMSALRAYPFRQLATQLGDKSDPGGSLPVDNRFGPTIDEIQTRLRQVFGVSAQVALPAGNQRENLLRRQGVQDANLLAWARFSDMSWDANPPAIQAPPMSQPQSDDEWLNLLQKRKALEEQMTALRKQDDELEKQTMKVIYRDQPSREARVSAGKEVASLDRQRHELAVQLYELRLQLQKLEQEWDDASDKLNPDGTSTRWELNSDGSYTKTIYNPDGSVQSRSTTVTTMNDDGSVTKSTYYSDGRPTTTTVTRTSEGGSTSTAVYSGNQTNLTMTSPNADGSSTTKNYSNTGTTTTVTAQNTDGSTTTKTSVSGNLVRATDTNGKPLTAPNGEALYKGSNGQPATLQALDRMRQDGLNYVTDSRTGQIRFNDTGDAFVYTKDGQIAGKNEYQASINNGVNYAYDASGHVLKSSRTGEALLRTAEGQNVTQQTLDRMRQDGARYATDANGEMRSNPRGQALHVGPQGQAVTKTALDQITRDGLPHAIDANGDLATNNRGENLFKTKGGQLATQQSFDQMARDGKEYMLDANGDIVRDQVTRENLVRVPGQPAWMLPGAENNPLFTDPAKTGQPAWMSPGAENSPLFTDPARPAPAADPMATARNSQQQLAQRLNFSLSGTFGNDESGLLREFQQRTGQNANTVEQALRWYELREAALNPNAPRPANLTSNELAELNTTRAALEATNRAAGNVTNWLMPGAENSPLFQDAGASKGGTAPTPNQTPNLIIDALGAGFNKFLEAPIIGPFFNGLLSGGYQPERGAPSTPQSPLEVIPGMATGIVNEAAMSAGSGVRLAATTGAGVVASLAGAISGLDADGQKVINEIAQNAFADGAAPMVNAALPGADLAKLYAVRNNPPQLVVAAAQQAELVARNVVGAVPSGIAAVQQRGTDLGTSWALGNFQGVGESIGGDIFQVVDGVRSVRDNVRDVEKFGRDVVTAGKEFFTPQTGQAAPPVPSGSLAGRLDSTVSGQSASEAALLAGKPGPLAPVQIPRLGPAEAPGREPSTAVREIVPVLPNQANQAATSQPRSAQASSAPPPPIIRVNQARTGLGNHVDNLTNISPTASRQVREFQKDGGSIQYGLPNKGSYFDPKTNSIFIDPANNPANYPQSMFPSAQAHQDFLRNTLARQTTSVLSHELGHGSGLTNPRKTPSDLLQITRDEYVQGYLKDEGAAAYNNLKIRQEIRSRAGIDIGIQGDKPLHPQYESIYRSPLPQDAKYNQMGQLFRQEKTSGTGQLYPDEYGQFYDDKLLKPFLEHIDTLWRSGL